MTKWRSFHEKIRKNHASSASTAPFGAAPFEEK